MFVPAMKNLPAVDQKVRLAIKEMEIAGHKALGTMNKAGKYAGDNLLVRHLYQEEAEALWYYFGHFSLHVSPIVIYATSFGHDWSPYGNVIGLQPFRFVNNDPHFRVELASADNYAALVHETVHVWQRQHGIHVTRLATPMQIKYKLNKIDCYIYNRQIKNPKHLLKYFFKCNVEQQAQIIEDYVNDHKKSVNVAKYLDIQNYIRNEILPLSNRKQKIILQSTDRG